MANPIRPNTFVDDQVIDALRMNEDFDTIYLWGSTQAMHRDGSVAFEQLPSGPGSGVLPTQSQQLANKLYVDNQINSREVKEQPARRMYKTSAQTIQHNQLETLLFGATDFNRGGSQAVEIDAPTGIFTVKKAGIYLVEATVVWNNPGGDLVQTQIMRGSVAKAVASDTPSVASRQHVSAIVQCFVNTTLSVEVFQLTGSDTNVIGAGEQTHVSIAWIGG